MPREEIPRVESGISSHTVLSIYVCRVEFLRIEIEAKISVEFQTERTSREGYTETLVPKASVNIIFVIFHKLVAYDTGV